MDMCLPEYDIYQATVRSAKLFKEPHKFLTLFFFFSLKKVLSDVRSEINLVPLNIVSTGKSVRD